MVIDFCEDYEEENGFSVWDAVTGQANNGKIAISSKLVEDFTAYGENYIHAGEVKLSVDTSHLGQTISVKAGTTPRYYAAGGKSGSIVYNPPTNTEFSIVRDGGASSVFACIVYQGKQIAGAYNVSIPNNLTIYFTPIPITDNFEKPLINGIPYSPDMGDLILDIPTEVMDKDLYTDIPTDVTVGVEAGILTPDGQVSEKDDQGVIDTPIPDIEVGETPTTGESLWDTLLGWLGTLFKPVINLLKGLWELLKGLFDLLKDLLTSILDLLKSLVKSLVDAIAGLFVPTLAFEDVFKFNQNTFFGQIGEVFNFDKLWNLTPKPYEFEVDFPFYDFAEEEQRPYHLEVKFFDNKFVKENINFIRNITTYPLLLTTIYFIVMHFIPRREMD